MSLGCHSFSLKCHIIKQFIFPKNDEIAIEESFEYHAYSSKITNEELKWVDNVLIIP